MNKAEIVIVGGGAGGLELATKLGNRLGRRKQATITLVDRNQTHIWKPLLHEVATGTLDSDIDEISYLAHSSQHYFQFQLGILIALDRERKEIVLDAIYDEDGAVILQQRRLPYDLLVFAIGSISNDFGVTGAQEHCIFLDSRQQAERFHQHLLRTFLIVSNATDEASKSVNIAIVGAGATGVELAAELHHAAGQLNSYGLAGRQQLNVTLLEAGERVLPALPEHIAEAASEELTKLGVTVKTKTQVVKVTEDGLYTANEQFIPAQLKVWAAGIKAPPVLRALAGLEINKLNQLLVTPTLQTTQDDTIFALGDCTGCRMDAERWVPPRAQAAHQQASLLAKNIPAYLNQQPLKPYIYKDYGSLVSLSRFSTVGNLMGNLIGGSMMIEGRIARLMYISLYRMHQRALHGLFRTLLITIVGRINSVIRPRLKLH